MFQCLDEDKLISTMNVSEATMMTDKLTESLAASFIAYFLKGGSI